MRYHRMLLLALIPASFGSAGAELRYRVRSIPDATGFPGYYGGHVLNDAGVIGGEGWVGAQLSGPFAFISRRAESGHTQPIGSLPTCDPQFAWVSAINNQGHVVGHDQGANCEAMAFLWTSERGMQPLGDLPGGPARSEARAVNAFDQVVGWSQSANGHEAFVWTETSGMVGLGDLPGGQFSSIAIAINDNSWVIGDSCSGEVGCNDSFLWTPDDGMIALRQVDPTLPTFSAAAINNAAQIAGMAWVDQRRHGGIWDQQSGLTLFGFLTDEPDEYLLPYDMNEDGAVIGRSWNDRTIGPWRAFLWHPRRGLHDVNDLLDPCTAPSLSDVLTVYAINNAGEMVAEVSGTLDGVFLTPYIPGDLDENEICDLQDLAIQLSNFSREADAAYEHGDLDCDQDVDLQDLAILLSNFGETLP